MPCQFCGQPCTDSNQLLTKHGELHIGCLLAAYDNAHAVVEAQKMNLEAAYKALQDIKEMAEHDLMTTEVDGHSAIWQIEGAARAALEGVEGQEPEAGSQESE